MAGDGVDQVHFAGLALVLAEGRDLFRIGRPGEHRAIAEAPAGVVGGVAIILHAVGGELRVGAAVDVADPQVVIAHERGELAVRRQDTIGHGRGTIGAGALLAAHVAGPAFQITVEPERLQIGGERDLLERQALRRHRLSHDGGQRLRDRGVIEGRRPGRLRRVDEDELVAGRGLVAIPEPVAGHPVGAHGAVGHQRVGVVVEEFFRALVVGHRDRGARLRGPRQRDGEADGGDGEDETGSSVVHGESIALLEAWGLPWDGLRPGPSAAPGARRRPGPGGPGLQGELVITVGHSRAGCRK